MTRNDTCEHCQWWEDLAVILGESMLSDPIVDGGKRRRYGTCHHHAPNDHFPTTMHDDWCGDFARKPNDQ